MPTLIQTSFAAGMLSPRMRGRVDLQQYPAGAEDLTNALVQTQGGATKRPGSYFVAAGPAAVFDAGFDALVRQGWDRLAAGDEVMVMITSATAPSRSSVTASNGRPSSAATAASFGNLSGWRFQPTTRSNRRTRAAARN